jgi:hypothetical protein
VPRRSEHPSSPRHDQFDLFPQRIDVSRLDPKSVAGVETRVQQIYVVKYERESGAHQIFHDRHGWYCADHGPNCAAVREATARAGQPSLR